MSGGDVRNDAKTQRLASLEAEIRAVLEPAAATRYMSLVQQWLGGELKMDRFDRKGRRLGVPIDMHTKYIMELGNLFDVRSIDCSAFCDAKNISYCRFLLKM